MPPKLSYETVKREFEKIGCTLLTKNYKSNKQLLEYLCTCGHTRTVKYTSFQSGKNLYSYNLCKKCVPKNSDNRYFKRQSDHIHPKTYRKIKRIMERKYDMSLNYRSDYLPENYNKKLTCRVCKQAKSLKLFPYRGHTKNNKETRCKNCYNQSCDDKVEQHTPRQHAAVMIQISKDSAKKRGQRGRLDCEEHTITTDDIMKLKEKQDNKCVYSGLELVWKRHSPNKASIDRIDSTKGYTPNNIQLVTKLVNQAKNNLTHDEFVNLISAIYKNLNC